MDISRHGLTRREWLACMAGGLDIACHTLGRLRHDSPAPTPASESRSPASRTLFGAALQPGPLRSDPDYREAFARYCRICTLAGPLYWAYVEPDANKFSFEAAEQSLIFADQHGIAARGHTLVWHNMLPSWVQREVSRTTAEGILVRHISQSVAQFRGRMHSWDVVNEVIDDALTPSLRKTIWAAALGNSYIPLAFRVARDADPHVLLGYNEFGLENDGIRASRKRAAVLSLLESLRSDGVPIDYLGIQGHLHATDTYSQPGLGEFVREVQQLGLKILITELDVDDRSLPADPRIRDRAVAEVYARFLDMVQANADVVAVITWGLSDRYTWLTNFARRSDGLEQRSLPFDDSMRPKAAWQVIAARLGIPPAP